MRAFGTTVQSVETFASSRTLNTKSVYWHRIPGKLSCASDLAQFPWLAHPHGRGGGRRKKEKEGDVLREIKRGREERNDKEREGERRSERKRRRREKDREGEENEWER